MLDLIRACFTENPRTSCDTVLHWGAGPTFDAELYGYLGARRNVLVEADAEAAEVLRESCANDNCEIVQGAVAAKPGTRLFRRFNLPFLNGFFSLGNLASAYPRAVETEQAEIEALTPSHYISSAGLVAGQQNILLLDLPGLETELIKATPAAEWQKFTWIFIRGAGGVRMENARSIEEAHPLLLEAGFDLVAHKSPAQALFPTTAYRLDPRSVEIQTLRVQQKQAQAQIASLSTERDAATDCAKKADAALGVLNKEAEGLRTRVKEVESAWGVIAAERDALQARAKEHEATASSAVKERDTLAARISALEAERSDLVTRHSSLATALEQLQGQHSSLITERAALQSHHKSLATEREALLTARDALSKEKDSSLARLSALNAERDTLAKERDQIRTGLDTTAKERDALRAKVAELEKQHQDALAARDAEIKDLEQARAELNNTAKERYTVTARISALEAEHTNLSTLYSSLVTEQDALQSRLLESESARDAASARAEKAEGAWGVLNQECERLRARIKKVEGAWGVLSAERDTLKARGQELEESVARYKTVGEEMAKAEGQLEMLKDLLRPALT